MTFNLFEIYRNHVRYCEIDTYARHICRDLELRSLSREKIIMQLDSEDFDEIAFQKSSIQNYKSSMRDILFLMTSTFKYPTQWDNVLRDWQYSNHKKKKNA